MISKFEFTPNDSDFVLLFPNDIKFLRINQLKIRKNHRKVTHSLIEMLEYLT